MPAGKYVADTVLPDIVIAYFDVVGLPAEFCKINYTLSGI